MRRLLADRLLLRAIFANPGQALAVLARDGTVRQANPPFQALAGDAPSFAEPLATQLRAALAAGETLQAAGELARGTAPIAVSLALSPAGAGEAVLRLTDLRPQRALEAQLAQAQRLQAVGALAAGIAHDFNNLLTVILGAAAILRDHVDATGEDELALISDSAGRGADLVRQMLAFSRQQTLLPRPVALNGLVQSAATLLRRMLGSAVQLDLRLEEPGRQVWADPTQLDQVLMNLAVNARDAMKQGGTLTISTGHRLALAAVAEGNITLPPGRYATLEVRDTGSGIPPDILPQIFDPFFTTRRGQGGTGLGLATVQGIVQQTGGYLTVSSAPGQGTCFRIYLPRLEPATAAHRPAVTPLPAPVPFGPAGRRVLLVEDEDAVRRLAALALRRAGWQITEAASGAEALEATRLLEAPLPFDLLVSDVIMPGLDGPGLVQALRQRHPGLPAILMSGYADAAQRQALEAADINFLAKPFSMAALTSAANKLVGQGLGAELPAQGNAETNIICAAAG